MKFTTAALFAALGFADAKRRSSVAQKKKNLIRSAKPVNKDGSLRKLNQQEWEITADYSIAFYDCVSLKVVDDDLFDENLYQLAYTGQIVAQKSYIMFDVIATEDVYYQSGSGSNLYMVDLDQWFEAMAEANNEQEQAEEYCQACEESYDICYPDEDDEEQEQQEEQEEENNEENNEENDEGEDRKKRKLLKKPLTPAMKAKRDALAHIAGRRRKLQGKCEISVDCYECEYKGCFAEEEENDNQNENYCDQDNYYQGCTFEEGAAEEFVKEAQCVETGQVEYNGNGEQLELKAGLMCNEYGTGVEMAIFLDDDCAVYDKSRSFSASMENTYIYDILKEAKYLIENPFKDSIDCLQCEYVALEDEDENQDNNQDEEEAEVTEVCDNVMNDALDLATCGGAEAEQNNNNDNNNDNDVDISWYEYDVEEDADDDQVCLKLQESNGEFGQYRIYETNSEFGGGGFFFDYGSQGSGSGSGKAGKIFGIIVAVLVVVVAGVFIGQSFAKKNDSKKQPLVSQNKGGAMA